MKAGCCQAVAMASEEKEKASCGDRHMVKEKRENFIPMRRQLNGLSGVWWHGGREVKGGAAVGVGVAGRRWVVVAGRREPPA